MIRFGVFSLVLVLVESKVEVGVERLADFFPEVVVVLVEAVK